MIIPSGVPMPEQTRNIPMYRNQLLMGSHPHLKEPYSMQSTCMLFLDHPVIVLHVVHAVPPFLSDHLYDTVLQRYFLWPRLYL